MYVPIVYRGETCTYVPIVYTDETCSQNPHYTVFVIWRYQKFVHVSSAKGRKLIIVHAGDEAACVPNALLNWRLPRRNEGRALHEVAKRLLVQNVPSRAVSVQPSCTERHRSVLKFEKDVDAQLFDQQKGL